MIVQEPYGDGLVLTHSDAGFYIHGGMPEGDYAEAIDPIDLHRVYIETNRLIEQQENQKEEN